jgi:hypothetical protein
MSLIILNELLDLKNLGIDTHFMKIGHKLAKNTYSGVNFAPPLKMVFRPTPHFLADFDKKKCQNDQETILYQMSFSPK